jgi:hypothetical protein
MQILFVSTGDNKKVEESRSGDEVVGKYQVVEPDGSLLVVSYTAGQGGYRVSAYLMRSV